MFQRAREFYRRHERWMPITFFGIGFLFDLIMLRRVDDLAVLLQQAAYVVFCALLIALEMLELGQQLTVPAFVRPYWKYREALLHFLLGTLLNSYTIFFFKSASSLTPYLFIVILIAVLILNEFKRFGSSQVQVHMAFWSLCLIAYLSTLAPIVLGFFGAIPFLVAIAASVMVFAGFYRLLGMKLGDQVSLLRKHARLPFLVVLVIFVALYFLRAIPPVPLSASYMGIYHDVRKLNGEYELIYTRPWWRFWENGDQTFWARPGDVVHCFARIFSPSGFKDDIQVRWLYRDARQGWMTSDRIPLAITGGREEGFRGVTRKTAYQPGKWRVQVETIDGREIGRIGFTILPDDGLDTRTAWTEKQ